MKGKSSISLEIINQHKTQVIFVPYKSEVARIMTTGIPITDIHLKQRFYYNRLYNINELKYNNINNGQINIEFVH